LETWVRLLLLLRLLRLLLPPVATAVKACRLPCAGGQLAALQSR
jgi:hypothetical protein